MKVEEESEKIWLKTQHSKNEDHGIQSHHFMAKDGETIEGLMLKLKLQYCGHLLGRTDSLEKTLMLGKIEGRKRRG